MFKVFWLRTSALLVLAMISVGGYTRLSGAGLSITEWNIVTGIIPPLSYESWTIEFEKYKSSPEFNLMNSSISINEFMKIYIIEYLHRMLGRFIFLFFLLPSLFYGFNKKSLFTSILIVLQGGMGWYMVKSGLIDIPHVSHFRLAMHLVIAVLIFILILLQLFETQQLKQQKDIKIFQFSVCLIFLTIVQIFLGGLVAGLNAGMIYNEFPYMGEKIIPEDFVFSLYDPVSVQFLHRALATILGILSIIFSYKIYNKFRRESIQIFLVFTWQYIIGILTLLNFVQIELALLHQVSAMLFTYVVSRVLFLSFN